jgi:hypothetical protein
LLSVIEKGAYQMSQSQYEKYIVRKPAIRTREMKLEIPDRLDTSGPIIGPVVWCDRTLIKEANIIVELGIIQKDFFMGTGDSMPPPPHKHKDYDEVYIFQGTNPQNFNDLGCEVEFWLGEGTQTDKLIINTSSTLFIPIGLAHFPLFVRNVKHPVLMYVMMPNAMELSLIPVSMEGRPTSP